VLVNKSLQEICDRFSELLEEGWQNEGVRPEDLEKYAALYGHPLIVVRCSRVVKIINPPQKLGRCLAYCNFDDHCFMYKSARSVSSWSVRSAPSDSSMIQRESQTVLPETNLWKDWDGSAKPGYYFCENLPQTRRELLKSGRSPKVTLHGGTQIVSLKYMCTKAKDQCSGLCVINQKNSIFS
jgi:hypothetical protein